MLHLVWIFWRREIPLVVKNQTTIPQSSSPWLMGYPSSCCHGINHKCVNICTAQLLHILLYALQFKHVFLYTLLTGHFSGIIGWSIYLNWRGCSHLHHNSSVAWISKICSYSIPSPQIQAWQKAPNLDTGEAEGHIQVSKYFCKKVEKWQYEVDIGRHVEHLHYASEIDIHFWNFCFFLGVMAQELWKVTISPHNFMSLLLHWTSSLLLSEIFLSFTFVIFTTVCWHITDVDKIDKKYCIF